MNKLAHLLFFIDVCVVLLIETRTEVERPSVDHQYDLPTWFGLNVTPDERYKNARLIKTGLPT